MMILTTLHQLKSDMQAKSFTKQRFTFDYRGHNVAVVYIIDNTPNIMIVGVVGTTFGFIVNINDDGSINPYIEDLKTFREIFGIRYNSDSKEQYSPKLFFEHLNNHAPVFANEHNKPHPKDYARYISKDIDNADKVYFCGWQNNDGIHRNVDPKNLQKTKIMISDNMYEICKKHNISSCWSKDALEEVPFYTPKVR